MILKYCESLDRMTIKAFWRAAKVDSTQPPYDTIHYKVLYPAQISDNQLPFASYPADRTKAPFPVVIFFSGANCDSLMYQWLAVKLVERGLVVILFNLVAENPPGSFSLTPGVKTAAWTPDLYGTIPSALALPSLLAELENLQSEGLLAGTLDLEKVVLGGHSVGGRLALENADRSFFPQVAATFAYGTSSAAFVQLGYAPGTILPLPSSVPMLLMGGTRDGKIAYMSEKWSGMSPGEPTNSITRTFREAISREKDDSYLIILEGANHYSIADPVDNTTSDSLDLSATQPEERIRSLISETIALFIEAQVSKKAEASEQLKQLLTSNNPLIASFESK